MATITVPDPVPSAAEDAQNLRKAFHGLGTDEESVIGILAHRDAAQRTQIRLAYEDIYKENLIKRLESELKGQFEKAVYRWMFEPVEREAIMANIALKKDVDYQVIIEIACINSSDGFLAVKQVYHARYKHSLEEDVASKTTGDFRQLLVALVSTYRYDGEEIDTSLAQSEAKIFHDAIKEKVYNHDEMFRILTTRSKAQLKATFNFYKDKYGSIDQALANESTNELVLALRMAIGCITSPKMYLVEVLRRAVEKSDEDAITRVVVMHAEKDLKEIKDLFRNETSVALEVTVAKVTSGDYKSFLLALVGN